MKLYILAALGFSSLTVNTTQAQSADTDFLGPIKQSMTFYASFDRGLDADFAVGDAHVFSVESQKQIDQAEVGMGQAPHIGLAQGAGRDGSDALEFKKQTSNFVFYQAEKNLAYQDKNWSGTFSFWLKVDPVDGLTPNYTDPVQLTDANYNDSAIWVDFTKGNPRKFRLAVICDREATEQNGPQVRKDRVSAATTMPFTGDAWTHVVITFSAINTDSGEAHLYFDGVKQASVIEIDDPFTWDLSQARIRLGLGFTGMIDELAAFNRALTAEEINVFHETTAESLLAHEGTKATEVIATGNFVGKEKQAVSGGYRIEREAGDLRLVLDEVFSTDRGPDLHVVLATVAPNESTGGNAMGEAAAGTKSFVVAKLASFAGSQTYDLPNNLDPTTYQSVLIQCVKYSHLFGAAGLE